MSIPGQTFFYDLNYLFIRFKKHINQGQEIFKLEKKTRISFTVGSPIN